MWVLIVAIISVIVYAYVYFEYIFDCRKLICGEWIATDTFKDTAGIENIHVSINADYTGYIIVDNIIDSDFKYKWKSPVKKLKPTFEREQSKFVWDTEIYETDVYISLNDKNILTIGDKHKIYAELQRSY